MEKLTKENSLLIYKDKVEGVRFYLKTDPDRKYEYEITSEWHWGKVAYRSDKLMVKIILIKGPEHAEQDTWYIGLDTILGELELNKNWIPFGIRKTRERAISLEWWQE